MHPTSHHNVLLALLTDLREKDVIKEVNNLLEKDVSPFEILETCQKGMRIVGENYDDGQYFISGLIMAGEIMRQVAVLLEPVFKKELYSEKLGSVLLGTVKGDIHDIGKNLFKILLECQGFKVHDLGVDVQPDHFLKTMVQVRPDIIGISSLLTVSYGELRNTINLLKEKMSEFDSPIPVIIGGGMTDEKTCQFVGADHWAKNAMTGVDICRELLT